MLVLTHSHQVVTLLWCDLDASLFVEYVSASVSIETVEHFDINP